MQALALILLVFSAGSNPAIKRGHTGATGAGAPAALPDPTSLCLALAASDKTGGWWCLNGDQTMASGSAVTFSLVNGPITPATWPVFPNSNGAYSEVMTQLNNFPAYASQNQYFSTASGTVTPPSGAFTTCALFSAGASVLASLDNGHNAGVSFSGASAPQSVWWSSHQVQPNTVTGDNSTCWANQNGVGLQACSSGANAYVSGATIAQRSYALHCGIFTPASGPNGTGPSDGTVQSCTYVQQTGVATCSTAYTHPNTGIGKKPTPETGDWWVGRDEGGLGSVDMLDGMFRGAFMTEKALSTADVARLGQAVLPSTPAGMTFVRASAKTCCNNVLPQSCVVIANNVPCPAASGRVEVDPSVTNKIASGAEGGGNPASQGGNGSAGPSVTASVANGPFGMKTAFQIDAAATRAATGCTSFPYNCTSPGGLSTATFTSSSLGVAPLSVFIRVWCVGGRYDLCLDQPQDAVNPYYCTSCPAGAGWCTLTAVSQSATPQFKIGNASDITGIVQGATTIYCQNAQITATAQTSYIPSGVTRAAETCTGSALCP